MSESSIPVIQLWNLVLVPLQGEITDEQSERLSAEVLRRIQETNIAGLIIDLTGLRLLDSHLCAVITSLASAAALMGTATVLSGLSPEIALTLQMMDLELRGVNTVSTLEEALEVMGIRPAAEPHASTGAFLELAEGM